MLRTIPIIIASLFFALILVTGVLTLAKPALDQSWDTVYRDRVPPLAGVVTQHAFPEVGLASLVDHRLQDAAEQWFDANILQRPAIVRAFNQALWSATGDTYMANGSIVSNRMGTLFEQTYVLVHCGLVYARPTASFAWLLGALGLGVHQEGIEPHDVRKLNLDHQETRAFAERLLAAQAWFAKRGQILIYMLGEAKTTWYADELPERFPCPEETQDLVYPPALAELHAHHINLLDGRAVLEGARSAVPISLFPQNGLHWNWLGAALASNSLIEAARHLGASSLADLAYDVHMLPDEPPYTYDHDLGDLLNLLYPPKGAPSPILSLPKPVNKPQCTLAAVNDSFFSQPAALLQEAQVFRAIDLFRYLTLGHQKLPEPEQPFDSTARNAYRAIFSADVVVLEEVETRIGGPYALMFLDAVEREAGRADPVPFAPSPGCGNAG